MYDKVKKVLLLVLAALVALFGVLYWRSAAGPEGVAYRDVLYFPTQEPDALVYTGKADGQTVSYAVGSDGSVTCRVGETVHGPYTIREDPSAVPDENWDSGLLTGIQISAGDAVLFRGGYFPQAGLLIREDGTALWGSAFHQSGTDREGPDLEAVLHFSVRPEADSHRGDLRFFALGTLAAGMAALAALFAEQLFRRHMAFHIREPEKAQPSDWELVSRVLGWLVLTGVSLTAYLVGLFTITTS